MAVFKEAQRREIELNLNQLSVFRVAQTDKDTYNSVVNEMKQKMAGIVLGENEIIRQSWSELKKRGG